MVEPRHADGSVCTPGREGSERAQRATPQRPESEARRAGPPNAGRGTSASGIAIEARVAERVGREGYERYFAGQTALRAGASGLEITVRSRFAADLLNRRFGVALLQTAREHAGDQAGVKFHVGRPAGDAPGTPRNTASSSAGGTTEAPPALRRAPTGSRPARRPTLCSLDDFVVGESNRLAHAAAVALADSGGPTGHASPDARSSPPNRLFLHGKCGLGKTHLLQGIARRIKERDRSAVVRYITGEAFTNEFIAAVRAGPARCDQFRKSYRDVDLLCIDDVHFLANKQATQSELLHTFDTIDLSGARVVLASDEHPRLIRTFSEALVSRFMSGVVVKLDNPERELRERIIRAIAARRGFKIEDPGVRLIAQAAGDTGSVRDLEGLVTRVEAVWRLAVPSPRSNGHPSQPPQMDMAGAPVGLNGAGGGVGLIVVQRALETGGKPGGAGGKRPVRSDEIVAAVCRELGVEVTAFMGRGRHWRVVLARSVASYLCRKMTTMSYPEIARAMGRPNHSTIVTAVQRLAAQIERKEAAGPDGELSRMTLGEFCEQLRNQLSL